MKKNMSYRVLNSFKEELLAHHFVDLPEKPTSIDLMPFEKLYSKFHPLLWQALQADLSTIGIDNIELIQHLFIPEDEHAQGATICYVYTQLELHGEKINIGFKHLVFQNIIHCYLHGNISDELINVLLKNGNNFISSLAKSYLNDNVSHLYGFF